MPPEQLQELPQLETYILRDNDLRDSIMMDYNATIFRAGKRLVTLDLARCNLDYIHYHEFSTLVSIQYLNLSGNLLQFSELYLKNCTYLKLLNLSNNAIEQLSKNFIETQLKPLVNQRDESSGSFEIDLSGNPLSCLCNASSFISWLQSTKTIIFTRLEHYQCLYPNGTWLKLVNVNAEILDEQCKIIDTLINNTKCPCSSEKLEHLHRIQYSL